MLIVDRGTSMAKGRPKSSDRDDVTVRLDRGIAYKLKMVAAAREISLAELLSELVRAEADRVFLEVMTEVQAKNRVKSKPKGPKGGAN